MGHGLDALEVRIVDEPREVAHAVRAQLRA